jgi:peptide/nickel transport system substrate-binding protein
MPRLLPALLMVLVVGCAACAPARPSQPGQQGVSQSVPPRPKRIVAGIRAEPPLFYQQVTFGAHGLDTIQDMLSAGLITFNEERDGVAQLAESVPTIENGLWKVEPDGRMETTWRIRPGAEWHDGTPFTSADVAFTARLPGEIAGFAAPGLRLLDRVETPDERTVVAYWKQPYIAADQLFTRQLLLPVPRHILEQPFQDDRAAVMEHPYWTRDFVGTGPFRLKELVRGSHLVLEANDRYVLGRPKIDTVEVRFILSTDVLAANLLAGAIELTLGSALALEQALEVVKNSRDYTLISTPRSLQKLHPNFVNPNPAVIGNMEFRRALLHAINRQEMIDTLEAGVTTVPISALPPNQAQYREIEASLPRYDYDPRRSEQMIAAQGYVLGSDGAFIDGGGRKLEVELRTTGGDDNAQQMTASIADYWQRVGVTTDLNFVPRQLQQDREYRALRPGFQLTGGGSDIEGLGTLHSSENPRADTSWSGNNTSRYVNAEFDAIYDRYITTISKAERTQALGQVLQHIAVNLPVLGIYYRIDPTVLHNRLVNIGGRQGITSQAWNSHEWDVK